MSVKCHITIHSCIGVDVAKRIPLPPDTTLTIVNTLVDFVPLRRDLTMQHQLNKSDDYRRNVMILDPAGSCFSSKTYSGAGASGAIYRGLGVTGKPLPSDMKENEAYLHTLGDPESPATVVHIVGPKASECNTKQEFINSLAVAYKKVFQAVVKYEEWVPPVFRMLPVSGSIFAGSYKPEIGAITAEALNKGFKMLSAGDQAAFLSKTSPYMALYTPDEVAQFNAAWEKVKPPTWYPDGPGQSRIRVWMNE